jgi:hypothetical protein
MSERPLVVRPLDLPLLSGEGVSMVCADVEQSLIEVCGRGEDQWRSSMRARRRCRQLWSLDHWLEGSVSQMRRSHVKDVRRVKQRSPTIVTIWRGSAERNAWSRLPALMSVARARSEYGCGLWRVLRQAESSIKLNSAGKYER